MNNRKPGNFKQLFTLSIHELHSLSDTACGNNGNGLHSERDQSLQGVLMNKHGISISQETVILFQC